MRIIRRHFLAAAVDLAVSLSMYSTLPIEVGVNHIDHTAWRAQQRWTTVMPRKGTTRSRGKRSSGSPRGEEYEGSLVRLRCRRRRITGGVGDWSGGMAWPAVGIVGGGEASAAAQPAMGGRSMRQTGAALGGWSKKTRG